MKKSIRLLLATAILMLVFIFTFHSMKLSHQKQERFLYSHDLPRFSFKQKNGEAFTRDSLEKNKATLVLHIAPSCGGCWSQLIELQKLDEAVNPLQILLVSSADWSELQKLREWLDSQTKWQKATIVQDSFGHFSSFFGTRALPAVFCYNSNWLLQEHFKGETKASALYPSISQLQKHSLSLYMPSP